MAKWQGFSGPIPDNIWNEAQLTNNVDGSIPSELTK